MMSRRLGALSGLAALCLLALATPAAVSAQETPDDHLQMVDKDDPEMNAAIAEAKRTLPEFLAVLARPPAGSGEFAFKYPLAGWEHIWVDHVARRGSALTGRLANVPEEKGFVQGQAVIVPLAKVSDWAWRDADGVMHGHRTTRVLLPRLDAAEAADLRTYLGWTE